MAVILFFIMIIMINTGGEAKPPKRILKGTDATLGEFPWMVSIQYKELHFCGGAIISDRHILTVAHCFEKYPAPHTKGMTIVTGTINKYIGGETHDVANVTIHKDFQSGPKTRWRNDIAVITLADKLNFSRTQNKIELSTSSIIHQVHAQLSGFGLITRGLFGESTIILQKTDVTVISNDQCNKIDGRVFDDQICGFDGKDRGFCNGDSGSPLIYNNKLIGLVSFAPLCGIGYPDVYTRVHSFLDWIEAVKSP